jgi:hypothetical protein
VSENVATRKADLAQGSDKPPDVVESPDAQSDALDVSIDSHRREQFAHAVAFGVPVPQALHQAGFQNVTVALGYSLLRDQDVIDIIDADRAWMREKMKISQEQIVAQLDNDRAFAYACENAGAAVAATMAKAKVVGIADPHAGKGGPKRVIIEWGSDEDQQLLEGVA